MPPIFRTASTGQLPLGRAALGPSLPGIGRTAPPFIKICGLSTAETVAAALEASADLLGFVSFPRSPRHVGLDLARQLAEPARGKAAIVLLLVDPSEAEIGGAMLILAPDVLQLHGHETPERVAAIRARFHVPIIKAIKVETAADVAAASAYADRADLLLFDAKPPKSLANALPGGNGISFNWSLLDTVTAPYMLSGGLTLDNIAAAYAQTRAPYLDVSSGVESTPGHKDPALIRAFIAAVRETATATQEHLR